MPSPVRALGEHGPALEPQRSGRGEQEPAMISQQTAGEGESTCDFRASEVPVWLQEQLMQEATGWLQQGW